MQEQTILSELVFKAIRSSGPGGQHANKVATKVEVSLNIPRSEGLNEPEKELLLERLASKLSKQGVLVLSSSTTRSQHKNKMLVIAKLFRLIESNLKIHTERKATKTPPAVIEKRLKIKKKNALKKQHRKRPDY